MNVLNALVMVAPALALALLLSSSFREVLRRALVSHFAEPLRAALRSRLHVEKLVDLLISLGSVGTAIGAVLGLNDQQTLLLAVAWGLVSWLLVIRLLRLATELEKEEEDKQRHRRTAGTGAVHRHSGARRRRPAQDLAVQAQVRAEGARLLAGTVRKRLEGSQTRP